MTYIIPSIADVSAYVNIICSVQCTRVSNFIQNCRLSEGIFPRVTHFSSRLTMNITFTKYILGSITAAGVVAWNSYSARQQFYPTCVHLATSKAPMAIISNFLFALFLLFGKSVQKIFLGPLRDAEIEVCPIS